MNRATLSDTEEFSGKSKVYEAKPSSRGFILSMDETNRHLCVLFRFCVLFFKCQDCWQALKDLQCAALLWENIDAHSSNQGEENYNEFILDTCFHGFCVAHYLLKIIKEKRCFFWVAHFWIHLGLSIFNLAYFNSTAFVLTQHSGSMFHVTVKESEVKSRIKTLTLSYEQ